MSRRGPGLALGLALAVTGVACGGGSGPGPLGAPAGSITVLAAASLTEAFTALGRDFEARHPGASVRFGFAGSATLARQLEAGAPADVFASADEQTMARAAAAGVVGEARIMARNRLALVVEAGNPRGIATLADLADPGVVLVLCAPQVPCGRLGAAALARAGVAIQPASLEDDVKAVVAKVALGEADAGIAYATDVGAAGPAVEGVDVGVVDDPDLEAVYPVAVASAAANPALAVAWIDFVLSDAGQARLRELGFLPA